MSEVSVNSNGVNSKIQYHILSDEKMKEIGFSKNYYEGTEHEKYSPYWWFNRPIQFPDSEMWDDVDFSFIVRIPKNGSDLDITIIDECWGQPYDYQLILKNNPKNVYANVIRDCVEELMDYLQDHGVLSGHVKGEYI